MTLSPIERLPVEVLLEICEYLGTTRLLAAASKRCRAVASIVTYSKIAFSYSTVETLDEVVDRWWGALQNAASFRHVRCLVINQVETFHENNKLIQAGDDLKIHLEHNYDPQHVAKDDAQDRSWQPVAKLIYALPGLAELHYSSSQQLAPCILNAVQTRTDCRLFMEMFCLRSLTYHRSESIRIEPDEAALSTSDRLHAITLPHIDNYDEHGYLEFVEETLLRLTAGLAPNLKKVSPYLLSNLCSSRYVPYLLFSEQTLANWKGTNIDRQFLSEPRPKISKGALLSLELAGHRRCNIRSLRKWSEVTDFSKLTSLKLHSHVGTAELNWLTNEAQLTSLQRLVLGVLNDVDLDQDLDQQPANVGTLLVMFFSKLDPLLDLKITGDCDLQTLDQIVNMHKAKLQKLAVFVSEDDSSSRVYASIAHRSWKLPMLEELAIPLHRTLGDLKEVQFYQWLGSTFPSLRKLFLRLDFGHIDEECAAVDSTSGIKPVLPHPLDKDFGPEELPALEYMIKNLTVDGELIKTIFKKISLAKAPGVPLLQRLELRAEKNRPAGVRAQNILWSCCEHVLGCPWVCERSPRDDRPHDLLTKRLETPLYRSRTRPVSYDCASIQIFDRVWPRPADKEWYEIYHSFPLVETVADIEDNRAPGD